ncbi:MAG TPA: hypothetical protein VJ953_21150 [Saprospiraceae bacterium]|nr:hypothetical protein [Saprospiraceae bacterium]
MKNKLLAFDYYFQVVTFSIVAMASLTFFGLMLLVPFGAYQVLSAGAKGVLLDSYRHRIFALIAGLYGGGLMFLIIENNHPWLEGILDLFPEPLLQILAVFAYVVIPFTSAIFYLRQSRKDFEAAQQEELVEYV